MLGAPWILFAVVVFGQADPPATIGNVTDVVRFVERTGGARRLNDPVRQKAGRRVIAAGKATTRFQPGETGVRLAVAQIRWIDPEDPRTEAARVKYVKSSVAEFNRRLKARGLAPNDLADGYALSHAIFHEAYTGKPVDGATVKANRMQLHKALLAHPGYQGMPSVERQEIYDKYAALALFALDLRTRSVREVDPRRGGLIRRAKDHALGSGFFSAVRE